MQQPPQINPQQQYHQQPAVRTQEKRTRISIPEIIIISFLVLIIGYFSFDWAMGVLIHHRAEVQVPDIKGKPLLEAIENLSSLQLALIKDSNEFNQALPEGSVLRQTPVPGTMVREGKTIRVVLIKGGEQVFVPALTGKPLRLAEIDLRQANLALGEVSERYSLVAEKGNVLSQDPESGTVVDRNILIHLVISSGEPPDDIILMRDFVGKSVDEAQEWVKQNNLTISKIIDDPFSSVPRGEVINHVPKSDTIIDDSISIQFTVGVSTQIAAADHIWHYALPQGSGKRKVVVRMVGGSFDHLLYKGTNLPGSKIEIPFHYRKNAHMRIFLDNILVEDREIP